MGFESNENGFRKTDMILRKGSVLSLGDLGHWSDGAQRVGQYQKNSKMYDSVHHSFSYQLNKCGPILHIFALLYCFSLNHTKQLAHANT